MSEQIDVNFEARAMRGAVAKLTDALMAMTDCVQLEQEKPGSFCVPKLRKATSRLIHQMCGMHSLSLAAVLCELEAADETLVGEVLDAADEYTDGYDRVNAEILAEMGQAA